MPQYSKPVRLPARPGDSVDITWVTCNFCERDTTVAMMRSVRVESTSTVVSVSTSVILCCPTLADLHYRLEAELDAAR